MNSPVINETFERKPDERKLEVARERESPQSARAPRMVLIDDDPSYTTILKRRAQHEGIDLDTFHSLSELGYVSLLRNYDVAIIDYDLGALNGVEIAEYMSALLDDMPMVLISASDRSEEFSHCPGSVRAFLNKSEGFDKILDAARQCISQEAS